MGDDEGGVSTRRGIADQRGRWLRVPRSVPKGSGELHRGDPAATGHSELLPGRSAILQSFGQNGQCRCAASPGRTAKHQEQRSLSEPGGSGSVQGRQCNGGAHAGTGENRAGRRAASAWTTGEPCGGAGTDYADARIERTRSGE